MPRLAIETSHALGQEEALRRLNDKADLLKDMYQDQCSDLHQAWNGNTLSFAFKAMGMKVAGTVTAEDSQVKLEAQLPLAAMVFKGKIEARIREQLGNLLA